MLAKASKLTNLQAADASMIRLARIMLNLPRLVAVAPTAPQRGASRSQY